MYGVGGELSVYPARQLRLIWLWICDVSIVKLVSQGQIIEMRRSI